MVPVTIVEMITYAGSGVDPSMTVYGVTEEYGSVQPSDTASLGSDGCYAVTLYLHASRNGNGTDSRQYLITLSAKDKAGNTGSAATRVTILHDQGD